MIFLPPSAAFIITGVGSIFRRREGKVSGPINAECRMQNAECRMQNAECGMKNEECGMKNEECRMRNEE